MKRILMVIGGAAHPFEKCAAIFKSAMEVGGVFSIEVTEDRGALVDLSTYDAVAIYTGGGEMSADQERGLIEFVRTGGGLVAIHCANAAMEKYPDYLEMVGTEFVGHGPIAEFGIETSDQASHILPRLSSGFTVTDEFYKLERRTEAELTEFQHATWQFDRQVMGYVRDFGEGRVFYTALGHDERTFRHPDFQDQVYKGLRYACGMKEGPPIRMGLLGYGPAFGMGEHHSQRIADTQGFELAAVCDRDPARLAAAKEEQGDHVATFADAQEMANSGLIDLGFVILPHAYHSWGIKTLLSGGVHVVTEKPFAVTVAECDEVIALAQKKGLMLSVYHQRHWDSDVLTLLHVIESGMIGELYSMECNMVGYGRPGQAWRSHKPVSGGALYDMGAHQLEKVLQLLPKESAGGEKINRRAHLYGHFLKKRWHDVTNEDYIRAYVRFDGGVEAQVLVSSLCAASKPLWTVLGTRGSVVVENWGSGASITTVDDSGARYTSHLPAIEKPNGYYKNLADHLLAGVPLIITPQWAKGTVQCIEGCEIGARENRAVEVEFDF